MKYESEGLFVALVSFPFYEDGKQLFEKVFCPFFNDHREKHLKRICTGLPDYLYYPAAYRMLGSYGLAIFSLIDDYAFSSRVFNQGHIDEHILENHFQRASRCNATILTGSSETLDEKPYLVPRAKETFLDDKSLYQYVGIIRIKIKCEALEGRGSELSRWIKMKVEESAVQMDQEGKNVKIIITDSYDSDELLVAAFSTNFVNIYNLSKGIMNLKGDEGHLIEACHASYGIRIGAKECIDSDVDVNMLVEPKPGHLELFVSSMNSEYKAEVPQVTVTGGGLLVYRLPVSDLSWIYAQGIAESEKNWMKKSAARIKLTLTGKDGFESENDDCQCPASDENSLVNSEFIQSVKQNLSSIGVSKTLRESVLSLFELFNYCGYQRIQRYYFTSITNSVYNLGRMIEDYRENNEPLGIVERDLNDEVNCLKMAISDRMNNRMGPNTVLEYGCGIQQLLHGFGFAYLKILNVLEQSPEKKYSLIMAKSQECTTHTHIEFNINHFIYPELYVSTVWKEASNFSFEFINNYLKAIPPSDNKDLYNEVQKFLSFLSDKRMQDHLVTDINGYLKGDSVHQVYQTILSLLDEDKLILLKYVLSDLVVFRFGFQGNFSLMWEAYFKVFLQMSSNYSRPGMPLMKRFIFLLMRLILISFRIEAQDWVKNELSLKPFDPILSNLWFLCFQKVFDVSAKIYSIWEKELCFSKVTKLIFKLYEQHIRPDGENGESERLTKSENLVGKIKSFEVIDIDKQSTPGENVICILNAFIRAVHDLTKNEKSAIHCLLRNPQDGRIWFDKYKDKVIMSRSSGVLADPKGGFVIPDPILRGKYFAYRTWLYRTLWDLSYRK